MILIGNEVGEEVGPGEGLGLISGGLTPSGRVVSEDEVIVVGDGEIDLKDAMAEGVVEEKSVGGVSVGVAVDAAESVGDIGVLGPRIVELVSGGNGWIGGAGRVGGDRIIYWGGVIIWKIRKALRLSSARTAQMMAMRAGRERRSFDMA